MNRIDKKFRELRRKKNKAFIAFIMAGDPSLNVTEKLVFELEHNGADIIELGVPFSDPLADGPTIQRSSERALKNKVNLKSVSNMVRNVRLKTDIPIVFLTYYNLIYHYGLKKFIDDASNSGVDGVIIPDLPTEESLELCRIAKKKRFAVIHLAAPTSSKERLKKIVISSTGFIYYVSITGITGTRDRLPEALKTGLLLVKQLTKKPVCVGFGISKPEQVKALSKICDGVIVGSAIVKVIERNIGNKKLVQRVGRRVKNLARAL